TPPFILAIGMTAMSPADSRHVRNARVNRGLESTRPTINCVALPVHAPAFRRPAGCGGAQVRPAPSVNPRGAAGIAPPRRPVRRPDAATTRGVQLTLFICINIHTCFLMYRGDVTCSGDSDGLDNIHLCKPIFGASHELVTSNGRLYTV